MATTQHFIHNDEPGFDTADLFHQEPLIKTIADSVAIHSLPPFVASLYGDWGQGKTSILEAVYKKLTGTRPEDFTGEINPLAYRNVRVIWFEAWRYQHDPTPVVALLNEIRKQLQAMSKFMDIKKEAMIAIESGLQILANVTAQIAPFAGIGGLVDNVKKNAAAWEQRNLAYSLPSQTIRELLNKAIKDIMKPITEPGKGPHFAPRLVIIIDDLDRCQPNVAYKLLEGLKIFLNLKSCSFLIGSNRAEITHAVKRGLQQECGAVDKENDDRRAEEYLEKLCSYSWDLPFPTTGEIADYVDYLLKSCRYAVITPQKNEIKAILQGTKWRVLPANPRRIKSFVNILTQLASVGRNAKKQDILPYETSYLLSLAYIMAFLPAVHRHLLANPAAIRNLHTLSLEQFRFTEDLHALPEENSRPTQSALFEDEENAEPLVQTLATLRESNATRYAEPFTDIVPNADQLTYIRPEATDVFRMAPILATVEVINDDLIHKYLPHALR